MLHVIQDGYPQGITGEKAQKNKKKKKIPWWIPNQEMQHLSQSIISVSGDGSGITLHKAHPTRWKNWGPGLVYYTSAKINLIREVEKVDIALEYFPYPPSKKCEIWYWKKACHHQCCRFIAMREGPISLIVQPPFRTVDVGGIFVNLQMGGIFFFQFCQVGGQLMIIWKRSASKVEFF